MPLCAERVFDDADRRFMHMTAYVYKSFAVDTVRKSELLKNYKRGHLLHSRREVWLWQRP